MNITVRPAQELPTIVTIVEGGLLNVIFEDAATILVKTEFGKPITFRGHPYYVNAEFAFNSDKNTWVPTRLGPGRFQRTDGKYGRLDSSESVAKALTSMCHNLVTLVVEHNAEKLVDASNIAISNKIRALEEKIAAHEEKIAQWQREIEQLNES